MLMSVLLKRRLLPLLLKHVAYLQNLKPPPPEAQPSETPPLPGTPEAPLPQLLETLRETLRETLQSSALLGNCPSCGLSLRICCKLVAPSSSPCRRGSCGEQHPRSPR